MQGLLERRDGHSLKRRWDTFALTRGGRMVYGRIGETRHATRRRDTSTSTLCIPWIPADIDSIRMPWGRFKCGIRYEDLIYFYQVLHSRGGIGFGSTHSPRLSTFASVSNRSQRGIPRRILSIPPALASLTSVIDVAAIIGQKHIGQGALQIQQPSSYSYKCWAAVT